jgi:hypothetical protein
MEGKGGARTGEGFARSDTPCHDGPNEREGFAICKGFKLFKFELK